MPLTVFPPLRLVFDMPSILALVYYSFDLGTMNGNVLTNQGVWDTSFNGYLFNSPALSTSRVAVGTAAMAFDASYGQCLTTPSFTMGPPFTVAFWLQCTNFGAHDAHVFNFGGVTSSQPTDQFGFYFDANANGAIYMCVLYTCYNREGLFAVGIYAWNHVAFSIDTSGLLIVYLNGAVNTVVTNFIIPRAVMRTNNYLAYDGDGTHPYLNGIVDEFYLFDWALSGGDVQSLYHGVVI